MSSREFPDQSPHLPDLGGVEPGRGLIEDEHGRLGHQRRRQPHALPEPPGKLTDRPLANLRQPAALQSPLHRALPSRPPQPGKAGPELQVLVHPHLHVEGSRLRQVADGPLDVAAAGDHVAAVDPKLARRRAQIATDHADRGGLTGTVGTEEADHLAPGDLEIDRIYGRESAELLSETVCGNHVQAAQQATAESRHGGRWWKRRRPQQRHPGRWSDSSILGGRPPLSSGDRGGDVLHKGGPTSYTSMSCLTDLDKTTTS